eukprot:jgi/Chrpa1/11231/Chrysochromulina_OHIO_Genome00014825-RA
MQAGAWRYLGPSAESWLVAAASWLVLLLLGALLHLRVGVLGGILIYFGQQQQKKRTTCAYRSSSTATT